MTSQDQYPSEIAHPETNETSIEWSRAFSESTDSGADQGVIECDDASEADTSIAIPLDPPDDKPLDKEQAAKPQTSSEFTSEQEEPAPRNYCDPEHGAVDDDTSQDEDPQGEPTESSPALAASSRKYAAIDIKNTSNKAITFEFKWGNNPWATRRLDPGRSRTFYYEYGQFLKISPSFYIKWGPATTGFLETVILQRKGIYQKSSRYAAKYEFYRDNRSFIGLRSLNGQIYPADWTGVAKFSYDDKVNSIYVGSVYANRKMRSWGYRWDYRVSIASLNLYNDGCLIPYYRTGEVRAKIEGTQGILDTGDRNIHSGAKNVTQVFEMADPGSLTKCTLYRKSRCET